MSNFPRDLNLPHIGVVPSDESSPETESKSIFHPIEDFLNIFGFSIPFRRKSKPNLSEHSMKFNKRFPNLYESTLKKEHIELSQFSLLIVEPRGTGKGHDFHLTEAEHPTWCDLCGDFIWGLNQFKHFLQCNNCNYTCHPQCQNLVKLDCKKQLIDSPETEVIEEKCEDPESSSVSEFCFSQDELRQRIDVYNATVQGEEFRMTLLEDCETFRGFIRVHMNLCRPINVVAGTRPPSLYDIIYDDEESTEKTLTSFYLPRNTVKALHINSTTTTQEVISALLKKFKVVDNPRKFALYERCYESGETFKAKMRRLQDHEKPLILALFWGSEEITNKRFILQENDTGDVSWEQFTYPELRNFLLILNREEEEYLNQVRLKYQLLGSKIKEAMDSFNYPEIAQEAAASSHTEADSLDLQATLPIQNFPDTFHQWDSEDGRPPSVASSRTLDSVHSLASSSSTSTANTMLRRPQTLMSPKRMQTSVSVLKNSNKKDSNLICSSIHTSTYQQPKHNV